MQLLINQRTLEIICAAIRKGTEHDFRIFKESKIKAVPKIKVIADKGYQGIKNDRKRSKIHQKKPRNGKLNPEQKRENKRLAEVRIKVEHIMRFLKIFRILSSRYRNRRKRFGLRVNPSAGIYNYELKIARLS
jgi:IS5 family transposase